MEAGREGVAGRGCGVVGAGGVVVDGSQRARCLLCRGTSDMDSWHKKMEVVSQLTVTAAAAMPTEVSCPSVVDLVSVAGSATGC